MRDVRDILFCFALLGAVAFVFSGCDAPAADACEADEDCFRGEICEAGRCQSITLVNNGGAPDAGGVDTDGGGSSPTCGVGKTPCAGSCVDTDLDSTHCGGCGESCVEGQVCEGASCVAQVEDCRQEPCRGFTHCDMESGQCEDGCGSNTQCEGGKVCDASSHSCTCRLGSHDCGGICVPNDSPATCGTNCMPCRESAAQTAVCRDEKCSLAPVPMRVAAGAYHSCELKSTGGVVCWGAEGEGNDSGQAEDEPGVFVEITAGSWHTCALTGVGEVVCWGDDSRGQRASGYGDYIQISAGAWHTCALSSVGRITCWGTNSVGEVVDVYGDYVQVSAGGAHTCALRRDGEVKCWGNAGVTASDHPLPEGERFIQISAGDGFTCGVTTAGAVQCWGYESFSASGARSVWPVPEGTFTRVAAGSFHACAIYEGTGEVECWGRNGGEETSDEPGSFTEISAGLAHNCARKRTGEVHCWGAESSGQLSPSP